MSECRDRVGKPFGLGDTVMYADSDFFAEGEVVYISRNIEIFPELAIHGPQGGIVARQGNFIDGSHAQFDDLLKM
ncbi:hypothetical protein ABZW18_02820 [Streptomyces sp. NPDC004647]|uniref:hypothetical protein n=1 Tax=Streptomyces sp. NPDC004647 TaxID=3154671 RepID=UPI0033A21C05